MILSKEKTEANFCPSCWCQSTEKYVENCKYGGLWQMHVHSLLCMHWSWCGTVEQLYSNTVLSWHVFTVID